MAHRFYLEEFMSFKHTHAVISGGASGLGWGVTQRIIQQGGKVALLDIDKKKGLEIAHAHPKQILFFPTDITDENAVNHAVNESARIFGSLNCALSCAGILGSGKITHKKGVLSTEHFKKVIDINLMGAFFLTRAVAVHMQKNAPFSIDAFEGNHQERGVIIHTASIAAYEGQLGQAAYSASKAAIVGMILPLAREFARSSIRCMAIAPGMFDTSMLENLPSEHRQTLSEQIPFPSRFGKPSEFAQLVEQIVNNPMLNGSVIRLDGAVRLH
jgi:NAD(P)-dependent dehydrogenase (short-subunit alcohol dehydrogenase family)